MVRTNELLITGAAWLPQNVRWDRKGRTIIIENPAEFTEWLASGRPVKQTWFNRLVSLSPFSGNHSKASPATVPTSRR